MLASPPPNGCSYKPCTALREAYACADRALEQYSCARCPYRTPFVVSLRRHLRKTGGHFRARKCKTCDFSTYSQLVFLKHVGACRGHPSVQCERCPYRAESQFFLTMHMSAEHGGTTDLKVEATGAVSMEAEAAAASARCRFCMYGAADTEDLRRHFLSEHTVTTHDTKVYACKKCHYVSRSKKGVQIHMKMKHREAKSYPCPYCSFRGLKPSSLEQHMWKRYSEHIEWFNCDKCGYKTVLEKALREHCQGHGREG